MYLSPPLSPSLSPQPPYTHLPPPPLSPLLTSHSSLSLIVSPSVSLPLSINATQGATITLDCDATGVPAPDIVWYKDGVLLLESDRLSISHDLVTIDNAFTTDSGIYSCVAVNVVDSVTADVVLDVRSKFVQWNIVNPYSVPMIRFPLCERDSRNVFVWVSTCR